ncbi:MAG: hypothetical protein KGI04_04150 [Candidatus Micrarchaeota archaeon]|nr:hypothetical protein [Candidatus Micrarchaeota archaeon]
MRNKKKKKHESRLSWLLYMLLFALIAMYALYGNVVVGGAALLLLVLILIFEVKTSVSTEGAVKSAVDIGVAVGAAVIFWVLLVVLLHTSSPIDAVSSCSMLPTLHRGDLVVLHGIDNISSFISSTGVPVVSVSSAAFGSMESNMSNEFLAYFAYFYGNMSKIAYGYAKNITYNGIGLYSTPCVSQANYLGKPSSIANCYVPANDQKHNLIKYYYSIGNLTIGNEVLGAVYTSQITVANTTITGDSGNPIVVYQTTSRDTFSGSVIHRVYAVLNVSGRYYFLTKGDNNQALDIEFGNYPANQSEVLGYVVADIPVVGYVKLLLSGQIATPAGCNETLSA